MYICISNLVYFRIVKFDTQISGPYWIEFSPTYLSSKSRQQRARTRTASATRSMMLLCYGIVLATVLSRSSLLHGIAATAASSIAPPVQQAELDLSTAAELIDAQCPPEFLRAVARSRRFLYRGEGLQQPRVLSPAPDLLQLETYGSQAALEYFMCLETTLAAEGAQARPSTGHIGTSRRADAEVWGAAASVWPINVGASLAYAWPLQRRLLWPATPSLLAGARCERSVLRLDAGLERALLQGHEVRLAAARVGPRLYRSPSAQPQSPRHP